MDSNHQIKSNQIRGTLDGPSAGFGSTNMDSDSEDSVRNGSAGA